MISRAVATQQHGLFPISSKTPILCGENLLQLSFLTSNASESAFKKHHYLVVWDLWCLAKPTSPSNCSPLLAGANLEGTRSHLRQHSRTRDRRPRQFLEQFLDVWIKLEICLADSSWIGFSRDYFVVMGFNRSEDGLGKWFRKRILSKHFRSSFPLPLRCWTSQPEN